LSPSPGRSRRLRSPPGIGDGTPGGSASPTPPAQPRPEHPATPQPRSARTSAVRRTSPTTALIAVPGSPPARLHSPPALATHRQTVDGAEPTICLRSVLVMTADPEELFGPSALRLNSTRSELYQDAQPMVALGHRRAPSTDRPHPTTSSSWSPHMSQRGNENKDEHDGPEATTERVDAPSDLENGPYDKRGRPNCGDHSAAGGTGTERAVDDRREQVSRQRDVRPLHHGEPSRAPAAKQPEESVARRPTRSLRGGIGVSPRRRH